MSSELERRLEAMLADAPEPDPGAGEKALHRALHSLQPATHSHRGLRTAMQADDMVIGAGAAKIDRIVAPLDRLQAPYGFVEACRLLKIGSDKFDAAQAAHQALRHFGPFPLSVGSSLPRSRAAPKSFVTDAPAQPTQMSQVAAANAASRAATAVVNARCSRAGSGVTPVSCRNTSTA